MAQNHDPLSLEELRQFGEERTDVEKALVRLLEHLDDSLVVVEETKAYEGGASRLVVFESEEEGGSRLYCVLAGREGILLVTPVDDLHGQIVLRLEDFDPLNHGLVSLAVTRRYRFVGKAHDLWLVVRKGTEGQDPEGEARTYHAVLATSKGVPQIQPSQDDFPASADQQWTSAPANGLRSWLRQWNFSCTVGTDPFEPLPPAAVEAIQRAESQPSGRLEAVAWAAGALAIAAAGSIELPLQPGKLPPLSVGEWIRCLALAPSSEGKIRGIVGTDARELVAFEIGTTGQLEIVWRQSLTSFPSAIAFLPPAEGPWPDLLIALEDGRLLRLRPLPPGELREQWNQLWERRGLLNSEDLLAALQADAGPSGWRKTLFMALLDRLSTQAAQLSPSELKHWTYLLVEQTRKENAQEVLEAVTDALVRSVVETSHIHANPAFKIFLDTLHELYVGNNLLFFQDHVDQRLMRIDTLSTNQEHKLSQLKQRAENTRQRVWRERREPQSAAEALRLSSLGLERWASSYLLAGHQRLPEMPHQIWAGLDCLRIPHQGRAASFLAVASLSKISFHRLRDTMLVETAASDIFSLPGGEGVQAILTLSAKESDRLVVAGASGRLYLLRFESSEAQGFKYIHQATWKAENEELGSAWALAAVPEGDKTGFLAVAYNRHRRPTLAFFALRDNGLEEVSRSALPLPRARNMDLVREGSGFLLLSGSSHGASACILRLDEEGRPVAQDWFRVLRSGTMAARFGDTSEPGVFACGERNGLLWCGRHDRPAPIQDLLWTFDMGSAVRAVERVRLGGKLLFVAGSEDGRLVLLEAAGGRRIWEHRFASPIRGVRNLPDPTLPGLVVALKGGRVAILTSDHDRKEALLEVRRYLKLFTGSLQFNEESDWPPSARGPLAFYKLEKGENFSAVLEESSFPETRARLIRYWAEEVLAANPSQALGPLLGQLTDTELMLLLSYLPEDCHHFGEEVWTEIKKRTARDGKIPTKVAAAVAFFQRFAQNQLDPEDVRRVEPPVKFFEHSWVRLEFARLLLQAVEREAAAKRSEPGLLAAALPYLLQLPPSLVDACAHVVRWEPEGSRDLARFSEILTRLSHEEVPAPEDVAAVATSLRPNSASDLILRLFAHLFGFLANCLACPDSTWGRHRRSILSLLRELAATVHEPAHRALPTQFLASRLKDLLPAKEVPQDQDPLGEQLRWHERLRRKLYAPLATPGGKGWEAVFTGILNLLAAQLGRVAALEINRLLPLVRPRLELVGARRDENNRLFARVRSTPEGNRQLLDVSLHVDAGRTGGLNGPGTLTARREALGYPEGAAVWDFPLDGYLDPHQQQLTLHAEIVDAFGYRSSENWNFPLPSFEASGRHKYPFAACLPLAFRAFSRAVAESSAAVTVAVLDADMSFSEWVEDWLRLKGSTGRLVDLDQALRHYGQGRLYEARSVNLQLLEKAILNQNLETTSGSPPTILVAPTREIIQRLIDGESLGTLEEFALWLKARAADKAKPYLVVAVSAVHACRLREAGLDETTVIAAHQLLLKSPRSGEAPRSLRDEAICLLEREADLDSGSSQLEELGQDLRWLLRWLRWRHSNHHRMNLSLETFFSELEQEVVLRAEMGGLPPFALLCLLTAVQATTILDLQQLTVGHVVAEPYRSTARKGPGKLIQEAGTPITKRSLTALRSDFHPKTKFRVEGLGLVGTTESRSALLNLSNSSHRDSRQKALEQLAHYGFGYLYGGIFRTGQPYRSLIERLYTEAARTRKNVDDEVYRDLKGSTSSPLDSLSLVDLAQAQTQVIGMLLPRLSASEIRALQHFGRLYIPDTQENLEEALTALFRGHKLHILDSTRRQQVHPLAELPYPVYAIAAIDSGHRPELPIEHVGWLANIIPEAIELAGDALAAAEEGRQRTLALNETGPLQADHPLIKPQLILMGPGAESLPYDPSRRISILRSHDIYHAAWEGEILPGLRKRARAQLRLTLLSPFQTAGALPSDSRLFVGREEELSFIKANVRSASILIVGSRRVGKTSLLNQVYGWARKERDLAPVYMDLQGCRSRAEFFSRWRHQIRQILPEEFHGKGSELEGIFRGLQDGGRMPVLLLNEIDGLARHDIPFIETLRGFNDRKLARFVMVGYSTIRSLEAPDSPFYHFTQGTRFNGKAIPLAALSPSAGRELFKFLSEGDLGIEWTSTEERERSIELCLERSYRIPWVLQRFGQLLIEHLEQERRITLSYHDVELILGRQGGVVWDYFDSIDYQTLGFHGKSQALRIGFKFLLFSLARDRYFLRGRDAPILDAELSSRSPLSTDLGFTIGEAREAWERALHQLLLEPEQRAVSAWINSIDLSEAFRLLTLTLALEPDAQERDRYGFLLHILPKELHRQRDRFGETLDQAIIDLGIEFMRQTG